MMRAILFGVVLLWVVPVRAQGSQNQPQTGADQQEAGSAAEAPMAMPPAVSGEAYPVETGAEERSNYLSIGVAGGAAYETDVFYGTGLVGTNDETYSLWPSIRLDRSEPRLKASLTYNPGFLFYQHTTELNQTSQNANGSLDFRTSPHSHIALNDSFRKTSDQFSEPYSFLGGTVSGAPGVAAVLALAPYANQISNQGGGVYSYQFSQNAMMGVGGGASELDYPNSLEAAGLYNANTYKGNGFYNLRFSRRQYTGVTVNYSNTTEYTGTGHNSQTQTTAFLPFYSFYPRAKVVVSVSAGPQYYVTSFPPYPTQSGWAPSILVSTHAELQRLSGSLTYQRSVGAGGGLLGVFTTDSAEAAFHMMLSRTWSLGASADYDNNKVLSKSNGVNAENGHMLTAGGALTHMLTEHLSAEMGFNFLHESYEGIAVIANAPDSKRVYGTLEYQLRRPLGR
ncbi:MAG TPA: hypothetical protein VHX37_09705 [Acidobacteriaceae bacterium]|jgi:hypothetical protein|nr:hypothetical protein [Acidobacteriaceae bacterium]